MPEELISLEDLNNSINNKELPSLDDLNNKSNGESGIIKGQGTGKSDSIQSKEENGTLIVPIENVEKAKEIYKKYINKDIPLAEPSAQSDATTVKISNGEFKFTPQDLEILKQKNVNISELLSPLKKKELTSPSLSPFIASPKSQDLSKASDSEVQSTLQTKNKLDNSGEKRTLSNMDDVQKSTINKLKEKTRDTFLSNDIFDKPENREFYYKKLKDLGYRENEINDIKNVNEGYLEKKKEYKDLVNKVNTNPNDRDANYMLGLTQLSLDKPQDAIQSFQRTLANKLNEQPQIVQGSTTPQEVASKDENALYGIGYAYSKLGNKQEAENYYKNALEVNPNNFNAKKALALTEYSKGNKEVAKQLYNEGVDGAQQELMQEGQKYAVGESPSEIKQAQYANDISKVFGALLTGDKTGNVEFDNLMKTINPIAFAKGYVNDTKELFKSSLENLTTKHDEVLQKEGRVASNVVAAKGLIDGAFGVMKLIDAPVMAAWDLGTGLTSQIIGERAVGLAMSPFTSLGGSVNDSEGKKAALGMVDTIWQLALMKGLDHVISEPLANKFKNNEPLTPEEAIKFIEITKEATPQEIKEAQSKVFKIDENDNISSEIKPEIKTLIGQKKTLESALEIPEISAKTKQAYQEKINSIDEELKQKHEEHTNNIVNDITKETNDNEIKTQIEVLNKDLENAKSDIEKEIINEQINKLQNGRKKISEPVSQGINREISEIDSRNEEITNELRGRIEKAREDFPIGERDGKESDTRKVDDKAIYDYAKENNLWINDFNELGGKFLGGTEHDIRINENEQKLYKKNNLSNYNTIDKFLEKIKFHNEIFPNTPYKFEGFTGIEKGLRGEPFTEPVYSQDFIKDSLEATPNDISDYMTKLGFEKINENTFKKENIEVSDLKPRNVLKDKEGNIYVIDAEFKENNQSINNNLKPQENATKERIIKENNQQEYPNRNESGETSETVNSNSIIESWEKQKEEITPLNEKLSGIKKALVPDNKIESVDVNKRSIKDVYEQGKELVDNGEINPELIIDEINTKARALQPNEVAALVYHKAKLDRTFDKLTDKLIEAKKNDNIEESIILNNQLNALSKDMDAYHEMALKTAYEQSLAFRSRQLLVDSEYNLKTQENKYKSINNGVLPEDVAKKFKEYDEQLKEINKKLRDLEEEKAKAEENKLRENAEKEAENAIIEEKSKIKKEKIEKIQKERKLIITNIKEKLRKARSGEQGLTAVPIPFAKEFAVIAPDVAKLMRNYAQEGVVHLDDFVNKIHDDLKDIVEGITKNDILNIIAGNYKEPKNRTEIQNRLAEVRRKAKLITRLELLENGELPNKPIKEVKTKNEEIEQLKKEIGEHDLTKLGKIKSRYENDIKKYEEKLNNKDFSIPEPKEKPELTKEIRDLEIARTEIQNKFDVEQEKARLNNRSLSEKIKDNFLDAVNLPKSLMASADMSAPLRQGAILSFRHPIIASKAFVEMFRQAFSEKKADKWLNELRHTTEYAEMRKHDLYISEPNSKLTAKEEQFISNIAKKIPVWGRIVKGSERAYTGYLNKLRVDVFTQFHDTLIKDGFKGKELDNELTAMSKFINNASGRGTLGKFEEAAPLLNSIFFSPRYIASRFNLINPAKYISMPKRARMEAMKSMGAFIGTTGMILALAKAGGAEVETDPRSSEFGKFKIGNTRYDLYAGFLPIVRLISQLATNEKKNSKGEIIELGKGYKSDTGLDLTERFIRSKLAPSAGLVTDFLAKKDFLGNPITWKDEALKTILPLWSGDIQDIYKEQGAAKATATTLANFFGAGVQYYTPKSNSNTFLPAYKEKYIDEKSLPKNL